MNENFYRDQDSKYLQDLMNGSLNIDDIASSWAEKFSQVRILCLFYMITFM